MTVARRALLAALGTLPLTRLARGAVATAHRLTILHMNDFHSRHLPVDARALNCTADTAANACYGGAARMATALAAERAAAEADGRTVVLLDAGDQFQGSLFYTVFKGDAELAVMRVLGTEAMAVGNHEFDNGPANLARFVRAAPCPVLSANLDVSDDADLAGTIHPWTILRRGTLAIGVVGLTTTEALTSSSPGPHVRIGDPAAALARAAADCRAAGATLVVALSHLGVAIDVALAGSVPGVAVFVGGHSHTLLSSTEPLAAGPHPTVVEGAAGRALVVQASCFSRYTGRLDLDLSAAGEVLAFGGACRHVGLDTPEHPEVRAVVARFAAPLAEAARRPVGTSAHAYGVEGCRVMECALGDFVADALLASVAGADAALMNAGGIRTGLPEGTLTLGDVSQALPFGNTIATARLRGTDLRAAVAHGLSRLGGGAFPMIAGLRAEWTPLAAPDQRLRRLVLLRPDGTEAEIDPAATYTIVTNNFMRTGGDGYTMLRDGALSAYDNGPDLDFVVVEALAKRSPLAGGTDGRLAVH